jgi:hypothetical protein
MTIGLAAAAVLAAGIAKAGTAETLTQECLTQLNMSPGVCACIGNSAEAELNEDEQAMVVAMIVDDEAASADLRSRMPLDQLTRAAMFMTSAPAKCARGG